MKHHPSRFTLLTGLLRLGHQLVDSLAGVALRRKCIDGAQRLAQPGQKSGVECKSKSRPDWISNNMKSKRESVV